MSSILSGSLQTECAGAIAPLLKPARYKGAFGGRGSSKSHFFADEVLKAHLQQPGRNTVCVREVQKSLKNSAKKLLEDKISKYGLNFYGFESTQELIRTPGGGQIIFQGMQDHTADSIKSLEGFDCAWIEEAQTLSETSLRLLRPTIRAEGSELWFSWNPRHAKDPVDKLLRGPVPPTDSTVVQINWSDNPWFPKELERERLDDLKNDPDQYGHVWLGEYLRVYRGAYYASALELAEREGRIDVITADPLLRKFAYWDIGGTSNKSDATAIWIVQFAGEQIRVLDHYEAVGQEFGEHVGWMHERGHSKAIQVLPHDGATHDTVHRVTPRSFLQDAGFKVEVCKNVGTGAAMKRVRAAQRAFPRVVFNRDTTENGRAALGWYHEKHDEKRDMGLGPEHDWSSHSADGFGQMAIDVIDRPKNVANKWAKPVKRGLKGVA